MLGFLFVFTAMLFDVGLIALGVWFFKASFSNGMATCLSQFRNGESYPSGVKRFKN